MCDGPYFSVPISTGTTCHKQVCSSLCFWGTGFKQTAYPRFCGRGLPISFAAPVQVPSPSLSPSHLLTEPILSHTSPQSRQQGCLCTRPYVTEMAAVGSWGLNVPPTPAKVYFVLQNDHRQFQTHFWLSHPQNLNNWKRTSPHHHQLFPYEGSYIISSVCLTLPTFLTANLPFIGLFENQQAQPQISLFLFFLLL